MDGKLAVIGLGSIGSMALWQASRLSDSVTGFEAQSPAHARSAVGGDTRLFRMLYRGVPDFYPILQRSRSPWAELQAETGQNILTRCGGPSIGTADGPYIPQLLETTRTNGAEHEILSREEMAARYPQHNLRPDDIAVYDPHAGALRTDAAVTAAVTAAQSNGATVHSHTPTGSNTETSNGVVITSGDTSWTFENVIVASGGWSQRLMPDYLTRATEPYRIYLTWFVARDASEFAPERFPVFSRISGDRSMYGAPSVDGATVKATGFKNATGFRRNRRKRRLRHALLRTPRFRAAPTLQGHLARPLQKGDFDKASFRRGLHGLTNLILSKKCNRPKSERK